MRVAAIQAAPVFLDPSATTAKMIGLMEEAAANGAELCAFPEAFLSGYPIWLGTTAATGWGDPGQQAAYAAFLESAVRADGEEFAAIAEAGRRLGLFAYVGFNERSASGGSVYCSLAAVHPERGVVSVHRKLAATFHERLIWAPGDGQGLQVHEWHGCRVGGLNCWENWMPLARHTLYAQGEEVRVAAWPGTSFLTPDLTRFVALEGRVYVLSAGGVLRSRDVPDSFPLKGEIFAERDPVLDGGTMIVGPDGVPLVGPLSGEETIAYADLDIRAVRRERQTFDPAGHYFRPDVFDVKVDRRRLEAVNTETPRPVRPVWPVPDVKG